jgi:ABC-type uncharacterized transport system ATPase subunit
VRLELRDVSRAYPGVAALDRLSLTVEAGRIGCLLGPSGSGKSTLLRAIAGFERPDSGEILADGELLSGAGAWMAPERRRIGMVFQDFALFPHLDAQANVAAAGFPCVPGALVPCGDAGQQVPSLACSYVVTKLPNGAWTFTVTAYDDAGNESAHSAPATKSVSCP